MMQSTHLFCRAVALISLFLVFGLAHAKQEVRIDASSDNSVKQSYKRMNNSLDRVGRVELASAVVQLNMIGVSSAAEMLADPELRNPGPVRIKNRIAGLSAGEIIALANKTATVKVFTPGQEPGVPDELLTPLTPGNPAYSLESSQWHRVTNINGFITEETLVFQPGGQLETTPASKTGVSTWEQSADEVRVFINDRYAVSRGKFVDADHIKGMAGNKVGSTWTWTATRK